MRSETIPTAITTQMRSAIPGAPPEEEALGPPPRTLEKREGDELHGTGDSGGQENTGPPRAVEEP